MQRHLSLKRKKHQQTVAETASSDAEQSTESRKSAVCRPRSPLTRSGSVMTRSGSVANSVRLRGFVVTTPTFVAVCDKVDRTSQFVSTCLQLCSAAADPRHVGLDDDDD